MSDVRGDLRLPSARGKQPDPAERSSTKDGVARRPQQPHRLLPHCPRHAPPTSPRSQRGSAWLVSFPSGFDRIPASDLAFPMRAKGGCSGRWQAQAATVHAAATTCCGCSKRRDASHLRLPPNRTLTPSGGWRARSSTGPLNRTAPAASAAAAAAAPAVAARTWRCRWLLQAPLMAALAVFPGCLGYGCDLTNLAQHDVYLKRFGTNFVRTCQK